MTAKQPTEPALAILTAEAILNAADTPEDVVPVPEWGGAVRVRGLTKHQQQTIRERATVRGVGVDEERSQQLLFMEGVVEPRFTEDHLAPLFERNAGAVDRVLRRLLELSGMAPDSVTAKEATFRP